MAIEKIKILGAVLELPAKQHCQFSLFTAKMGQMGPNWQCYLTGSSKTAPRIFIFSMAMGADYSFELISNETYAPQSIGHNRLFLGSVLWVWSNLWNSNTLGWDCCFHRLILRMTRVFPDARCCHCSSKKSKGIKIQFQFKIRFM